MNKRVAAAVILVAAVACTSIVVRNGISPRYTLHRLHAAVDARDLETFERYADVDALSRQLDRAMPRRGPWPGERTVSVKIPDGVFAPQFREQIVRHVAAGEPLSEGLRPLFEAIHDGLIVDDRANVDGTRTITLAGSPEQVRVVMTRDGAVWRITAFEDLRIPPPPVHGAPPPSAAP